MNDLIEHNTIRQEPPVFANKIEILHEDENILAVNKPASMPVLICLKI